MVNSEKNVCLGSVSINLLIVEIKSSLGKLMSLISSTPVKRRNKKNIICDFRLIVLFTLKPPIGIIDQYEYAWPSKDL